MEFEIICVLIGVVGKKGNGVLDNGDRWETDRVELHVLTSFDTTDSMAHGQTVAKHNLDDYAANYDKAKGLIDQRVKLRMKMVAAKTLGQAAKLTCVGIEPADGKKQSQVA